MNTDKVLTALWVTFVISLLTLAITDDFNTKQNLKNTAQLLHQQGFIQVKFHDTEIWIKPQDAQSLLQTNQETKNGQ